VTVFVSSFANSLKLFIALSCNYIISDCYASYYQKVSNTRKDFPNSSFADLYDPLTMLPALVKAHQELDKAVDLCYRPQPFPNETKRIEFLFELYEAAACCKEDKEEEIKLK
jgi:hypothetical protein